MQRLPAICLSLIMLALGTADVLGQGGPRPVNGQTYAVLADGAGGWTTLIDNLRTTYNTPTLRCRQPIICRIPWAVDDDNLNDYLSGPRHVAGANKMACEVQRIRAAAPDSPIVLIGYSAGASVVLLAAERLPPGSVDRIILLGPAISARYDPRRALLASKQGIDSFNVPGDDFMEMMEEMFGAPYEIPGTKVAGTVGFRIADPRSPLSRDPLLGKLRQHNVGWLENGHFGTVYPRFLARFVVPMIPYSKVNAVP